MRDAVGAGVAAVLRLYEERAAELGLAAALRRGPRCPSLADALEGLQDVERYYRHLYPSVSGLWAARAGAVLSVSSLPVTKVPGERPPPAPHQLRQPGGHGSSPAGLGEDLGALQG